MRVGGKSPEVSRHVLKVSPTNSKHFKAYDKGVDLFRNMGTTKKLTKILKLRGLKLCGF